MRGDTADKKALFVPLRGEHFDSFARGTKHTEFRRLGPRWNAMTCSPGRAVTLSRGYSGARLAARVVAFDVVRACDVRGLQSVYPDVRPYEQIAAIRIEVMR